MGKNRPFLVIGAGIFLALLVSIFTYNWLQKKSKVEVRAIETQQVVVASVDLPWGTVLGRGVVKLEPFLRKSLPGGCFIDPAAVEGRTLLNPVKAGELVMESRLAPTTVTGGGVSAIIAANKRAMAVKVDKVVGVSGFIHPGNRVDVMVTLDKQGEVPGPIAKIVLENILVLATGPEMEKTGKQEKPTPVDVITLEVTPEEGEKLALAANEGKLQLALRNQIDLADFKTRGITVPALLASYRLPGTERPTYQKKRSAPTAACPREAMDSLRRVDQRKRGKLGKI